MNYSLKIKSATRQMRLFHCLYSLSVPRAQGPEVFWTACFTVREHPSVVRAHALMGFGCLTQPQFIRRCSDSWQKCDCFLHIAAEKQQTVLHSCCEHESGVKCLRSILLRLSYLNDRSTGEQLRPFIWIRVNVFHWGVTNRADLGSAPNILDVLRIWYEISQRRHIQWNIWSQS